MSQKQLRPEILDAALKLQAQLAREPYSDVGITFSQHNGEIRRIDYSVTVKIQPTHAAATHVQHSHR